MRIQHVLSLVAVLLSSSAMAVSFDTYSEERLLIISDRGYDISVPIASIQLDVIAPEVLVYEPRVKVLMVDEVKATLPTYKAVGIHRIRPPPQRSW